MANLKKTNKTAKRGGRQTSKEKKATARKASSSRREKKEKIVPEAAEGISEDVSPVLKEKELEKENGSKYFEAVGRRKTAVARVRLFTSGEKEILINNKKYQEYFPLFSLQKIVESPLEKLNSIGKFGIFIKVSGGGITAQAEACRHGISRALVLLNQYFRKRLKKAGYLTRDSRMRERKKFGLKRARKAPQWSKR